MSEYSHSCPLGKTCPKISDPAHCKAYVHVKPACTRGSACTDLSEEHNAEYFHPGASSSSSSSSCSWRVACNTPWCSDVTPKHRRTYAHGPVWLPHIKTSMVNVRNPTPAVTYGMWVPGDLWRADFAWNTTKMLRALKEKGNAPSRTAENVRSVAQWVRTLRPVVRMSNMEFSNTLRIGWLSSTEMKGAMWTNAGDIVESVFRRSAVSEVLANLPPSTAAAFRKYGRRFVKSAHKLSEKAVNNSLNPDYCANKNATAVFQQRTTQSSDDMAAFAHARISLVQLLDSINPGGGEAIVNNYESAINSVMTAVIALVLSIKPSTPEDENVGSRYTIPALLGDLASAEALEQQKDDNEIALVIRQEVMFHPDFFITPVRATLYPAARYASSKDGALQRPWAGPEMAWDAEGGSNSYFHARLHPSDPRWAEALAKEWICRVSVKNGVSPERVTLNDVKRFLYAQRPEYGPEAHLPCCVPLEYVEQIVCTTKTFITNDIKPIYEALAGIVKKYPDMKTAVKGCRDYIESNGTSASLPASEALGMHVLQDTPSPALPAMYGFSFTVEKEVEHFLPATLSISSPVVHFAFSVRGGPFSVALKTIGNLTPPQGVMPRAVTFHVGTAVDKSDIDTFGEDCEIDSLRVFNGSHGCSLAPVYEDPGFNKGTPQSDFVQYILTVDYAKQMFFFHHWGPSALCTSHVVASVKMEAPNDRYSYVSFASWTRYGRRPIVLNASEILATSQFAPLFGLEREKGHSLDESAQVSFPQTKTVVKKFAALPLCKDPINCPLYRCGLRCSHPKCKKHIGEYSHICCYGRVCYSFNDKNHCKWNRHLVKPDCPDGSQCTKLSDPLHRLEFFHPGEWDYLITCKLNSCGHKNQPSHTKKYCHNPPSYPKFTEFYEKEM